MNAYRNALIDVQTYCRQSAERITRPDSYSRKAADTYKDAAYFAQKTLRELDDKEYRMPSLPNKFKKGDNVIKGLGTFIHTISDVWTGDAGEVRYTLVGDSGLYPAQQLTAYTPPREPKVGEVWRRKDIDVVYHCANTYGQERQFIDVKTGRAHSAPTLLGATSLDKWQFLADSLEAYFRALLK